MLNIAMTLHAVQVRGPNYLRDKKKVPATEPLFSLAAVDLVECETGCFHIAQHLPSLKCAPTPCTYFTGHMHCVCSTTTCATDACVRGIHHHPTDICQRL